jgi:hypothetical protein
LLRIKFYDCFRERGYKQLRRGEELGRLGCLG